MQFTNPTTISSWVQPHSVQWYNQLSDIQGTYTYPWNSTILQDIETIFDEEVARIIANQKVLDVGCGHGEITVKNGLFAKQIVGFDVTDQFVQMGRKTIENNVTFVLGNAKEGLPFSLNEFDCAYIRKGPTSAYPYLNKVVKKGGEIMGLHPGDATYQELPKLFPGLFESTIGTPILDTLNQRLEISKFSYANIEIINSTEFILTPIDLLKLCCFGQHPSIFETLKERDLQRVTQVFEQHATVKGLPVTLSRYLIRATI